jgi:hypothetical protein
LREASKVLTVTPWLAFCTSSSPRLGLLVGLAGVRCSSVSVHMDQPVIQMNLRQPQLVAVYEIGNIAAAAQKLMGMCCHCQQLVIQWMGSLYVVCLAS